MRHSIRRYTACNDCRIERQFPAMIGEIGDALNRSRQLDDRISASAVFAPRMGSAPADPHAPGRASLARHDQQPVVSKASFGFKDKSRERFLIKPLSAKI